MNLGWLIRMAWRDSRRNRSRLLLFMGSISAGIAALVAIYSFGADLRRNVDEQAASLIGADLSVSTGKQPSPATASFLDSLGPTRSREEQFGSMVLFPRTGGTRLVQIRALGGAFPYYGELETTPAAAGMAFRNGQEALVDKALMLQYGARVGDSIRVGNVMFGIAGALDKAPGQTTFTAGVAPVVYIPFAYMDRTGLNQKGSRVQYNYYYKFAQGTDVEKLVRSVAPRLDSEDLRYETVAMRKENTGHAFENMTRFLSLVGFVALLLGCIGVASAVQIYIREKSATIAVMRCLGVTVVRSFLIYLIQVVGIGFLGACIGSLLGVGVQELLPRVFKDLLPISVTTVISWSAILQGLVLGVVISIVFGLLPLLSIRRITPLYTLRSSYEPNTQTKDPLRWPVFALILGFIVWFSYIQLQEWKAALFFTIGLICAYGILSAVARGLMITLRLLARNSPSFLVRQGFANLYRPNNQTVILVVAIGLSAALISILFFTQDMLVSQLNLAGSKSQANMILFDIQNSQEAGLDSLVRAQGLPVIDRVPIVAVRISSIKGKTQADLDKDTTIGHRWERRRALNEELRITYRKKLSGAENLTEGKWTGQVSASGGPVPVSFEDGYARHLDLRVGDPLVFNVQGIDIPAVVGSLRKVEWNRMQTNFRIVFPAGVLEDAPQFHVLLTRTPSTDVAVRFQQAVVRKYPTVSIIDLSLILSVLEDIIDKINYAVHFMASFSIITGLIVLIASVRNSKYQRIQESVLLRTLGAGRRQVLSINALEYFFLGALAALTGIILAVAGTWLLAKFLFKLPFSFDGWPALALFAIVSLLTMTLGLLNSRGILRRSTLEVLRTEV